MKAIVYRTFGAPEVLRLEDVPQPEPSDGELLIRVRATVVTAAESAARRGRGFARLYFGPLRPRFPILGSTFSGEVVATGPDTSRHRIGDEVFGTVGPRFGALAEYARVPEAGAIAEKPASLDYSQAVAVFDGALTALPFLRDHAELKPGQSILVNGASGAVGTAATQLAKHFGANVTGVCSAANQELVRELGADDVIDYTGQDFTKTGRRYDVVFDAIGKSSFAKCRGILTANGRYLTTVPSPGILLRTLLPAPKRGKRGAIAFTGVRPEKDVADDLRFICELAASGSYVPVIDRSYPLAQAAQAHRYVDTERKRGSVVVTIGEPAASLPS